jgi:hypothetical protein
MYAILLLLRPQAGIRIGFGRFHLRPVGFAVEKARYKSSAAGAAPYSFAPSRSINDAAFGKVPHAIEGARFYRIAGDHVAERFATYSTVST